MQLDILTGKEEIRDTFEEYFAYDEQDSIWMQFASSNRYSDF